MRCYYNEIEPFAVDWLKNLVASGELPPGDVDDRPIQEVHARDLAGYTQCHFFAGIGGWPYALRLAGWPDDRPVWTGSCPCQPFSAAGKRGSHTDERHLWPAWFRLIRECHPRVLVGEQVSGAAGLGWLDAVVADLESEGYACGAVVLGAHSVGAPHLRQRLWFVADADRGQRSAEHGVEHQGRRKVVASSGPTSVVGHDTGRRPSVRTGEALHGCGARGAAERSGPPRVVADADGAGPQGRDGRELRERAGQCAARAGGASSGVADTDRAGQRPGEGRVREPESGDDSGRGSSPWADLEWLPCRDGKARPTQPGLQPLAHGIPGRVGRLRAYGNAIVPQVGAAFVRAYLETER